MKIAFTTPQPTGASPRPTLLVADIGNDRVQEVDVVDRVHVGYLYPPGAIAGPRAVAASQTTIAFTAFRVTAWAALATSAAHPRALSYLFNADAGRMA